MKKDVYSLNVSIDGVVYSVDLKQNDNKYNCTVLLIDNENDTVTTVDRFTLVHSRKEGYYWAWTGDLMAYRQEFNLRNEIADCLTAIEWRENGATNQTSIQF